MLLHPEQILEESAMNALHRPKRAERTTTPSVERLDLRIAPTTVTPAGAAAANLAVHHGSASVTARRETRLEKQLARRLQREEKLIERRELRLERPNARAHGHDLAAIAGSAALAAELGTLVSMINLGGAGASASSGSPATVADPPMVPPTATSPSPVAVSPTPTPTPQATSGSASGTASFPPNVDQVLAMIYEEYEQDPSGFTGPMSSANGANLVVIQGDDVGIQVHDGNPADFPTLVTELQNAGMQITAASATYGTVVGLLPIAQLPTVGGLPQDPSVAALMQPMPN
jgi:hypothetical protein